MIFCFHKYLFVFLKIGDQKRKGKRGSKKKKRANFEMSDNFLMFKKFAKKYTKAEKTHFSFFFNLDKEL